MSVSVFNPMRLNEFHRMKFPDAKMHHAQRMTPSLDRVRRDLFGPVDREECNRFAEEELAKHQIAASQRWGFDFVRGKPLEDTKLYLWERVPPTNTNDIPEMYTLSRAAHIRHIEADHQMRSPSKRRQYCTPSYIDLLDKRSEQSNNHIAVNNVLDLSFEDVDAGHSSASSSDEESFNERTSAHHEKMIIDTTDDNLNCSSGSSNSSILLAIDPTSAVETRQQSDVRLTALSTITSAPKAAPVVVASTSVSVRRSNTAATAAATAAATNAQCNRTSCRATNTVSRNLRSSPRNREKRQPKITDYLKERKRLQPTPKKVSPKKARTSNDPVISNYLLRH